MSQIDQAADLLMDARLKRQRVPTLPGEALPADVSGAYQVQQALIERLLDHHGGQRVGYKAACTNEAAQRFLDLDAPFHGPLLSALVYANPARLPADSFFMRVIEPEFAFEMAADLPPRARPYSRDEVTEAVGALMPAIELVDSRYTDWTTVGGICLIADHAVHGGWVKGEAVADWRHLDLLTHEMRLYVNDELTQVGNGSVVLGHPLNVLTWLANDLHQQGQMLKAGDWITTGVCVDEVYYAQPGDRIKADFGVLGTVEVDFD